MATETIYDLLQQDHREVNQLIQRAHRADADERDEILGRIMQELAAHAQAEQVTFYAALRSRGDGIGGLVAEAEGEHHHIAEILDGMDHTTDSESVREDVMELAQCVQHHVAEEEGPIFQQARSILGDDEARELAKRFAKEKQQALEMGIAPEDLLGRTEAE